MSGGILAGAHNLVFHDAHLVDESSSLIYVDQRTQAPLSFTYGLQLLHSASVPEATLFSAARHPVPRRHPNTYQATTGEILRWCLDNHTTDSRILTVMGPAASGKTTTAQHCAETLFNKNKLAGAFFFPSNNHKIDPNRLFPSLSYEYALRNHAFGRILGSRISRNPTLINDALPQQFQNLFVGPVQELQGTRGGDSTQGVVIIDNLDACGTIEDQKDIVGIIADSVRQKTTTFLWIVFCRHEPHLARFFSSPDVSIYSAKVELSISREFDNEISLFLTDKLSQIAQENGLALPWPSRNIVDTLVDRSAGFILYAASIVDFVGDRDSRGPEEQLQIALSVPGPSTDGSSSYPLSKVDARYTGVMERVSPKLLGTVQRVLLAITLPGIGSNVTAGAQLLGLSEREFRKTCQALHPVMRIIDDTVNGPRVVFYHPSFMEYVQDRTRAKQFYLGSSCAASLRENLFRRMIEIQTRAHASSTSIIDSLNGQPRPQLDDIVRGDAYENIVSGFFALCQSVPFDDCTLAEDLEDFDFGQLCLLGEAIQVHADLERFLNNIPPKSRKKIIRPCRSRNQVLQVLYRRFKPSDADMANSYILGHGPTKAFCWGRRGGDHFCVVPYPKHALMLFIKHSLMGRSSHYSR